MPMFQLKLTDYEIKTRELFNEATEGDKWSSTRATIANIFVANASSALPLRTIFSNAVVNHCWSDTDQNRAIMQKELTKLCREKVLRSRRAGGGAPKPGETVYEVNY